MHPGRLADDPTPSPRSRTRATSTSSSSARSSRSSTVWSTPSRERGRLAFGPTADGARLEGSKAWMKEVLAAAGVPTARHATFGQPTTKPPRSRSSRRCPGLYVVKTDGLAAGKGVVVTESIADARDAVRAYLSGAAFGDAGRTVVIEEGLRGPELSLLVVCNGDPDGARPLAPAQDFKRIGDGDTGPQHRRHGRVLAGPDRRRRRSSTQ